jgi:hypothetical protein
MNLKSGKKDLPESASSVKDNKARCIFCRKCYNSGLCMMPWPGFPVSRLKEGVKTGDDNQKKRKD